MSTTELTAVRGTTESGVVEVRVRHVDAEAGPTLGWFPVEALQRLIDNLLRWGIYDEDGKATSNTAGVITGTFRLETDAYFEIVVDPEPASE